MRHSCDLGVLAVLRVGLGRVGGLGGGVVAGRQHLGMVLGT